MKSAKMALKSFCRIRNNWWGKYGKVKLMKNSKINVYDEVRKYGYYPIRNSGDDR